MKQKKPWTGRINLGTVVFLVIAIYLAGYSLTYLGKHKLATYEVEQSDLSDVVRETGAIVRDEVLMKSPDSGYICYYRQDRVRVKSGGIVYLLDKTGDIRQYLEKLNTDQSQLSSKDLDNVYDSLKTFSGNYSDLNYNSVYETKSDIQNILTSYTDTQISKHKKEIIKKYGKDSFEEIKTDSDATDDDDWSGIVCYSSDGCEDIAALSINRDFFKQNIKMKDLRTDEKVEKDTPVYRLVRKQKWRLVVPITEDEYNRIGTKDQEKDDKGNLVFNQQGSISLNITKDNFTTTARYKLEQRDDGDYIVLVFDNYVQRYINQRFLTVEFLLSEQDGLKIPTSSLVTKKVFKVPVSLLSEGSNSETKNTLIVLKGDDISSATDSVHVTIYKQDDDYCWVYADSLKPGKIITDKDKKNTFTLEDEVELNGVYCVNRGYAEFKLVDFEYNTTDYCIIKKSTSDIQIYDRIILNSDTIKENQIIY